MKKRFSVYKCKRCGTIVREAFQQQTQFYTHQCQEVGADRDLYLGLLEHVGFDLIEKKA